jgi:quercetin dioxygenase-like cupin family protein
MPDLPHVLHDLQPIITDHEAGPTGVVWRLEETGRQLDANALNLAAGTTIDTHAEPDLDVLLVILAGGGSLATDAGRLDLAPGAMVWLPRGSTRSLAAGNDGLAYLTVHRRRPGMQIRDGRATFTGIEEEATE